MKAKAKILCIDDETMILETISDYLEDSGYIAYKADSGKKGLELYYEKKPDIILLDLHMPDISGLEILDKIRSGDEETGVIIVSGAGDIRYAVDALRLKAWDYFPKPVKDMRLLEIAIEKALKNRALLIENRIYKENLEQLVEKRAQRLHFQANLLDNVRESIMAKNLDGEIIYWSKGAEELYGYSRDEAIGGKLSFIADESKREEIEASIENIIETEIWSGKYLQRRKDGSTFWSDAVISLVKNPADEPVGMIGVDRDVTKEIEAQNKIKKFNEELENMVAERTSQLRGALEKLRSEIEERKRAESDLLRANKRLEESEKALLEETRKLTELNAKLVESEKNLTEANKSKDKFFSIIAHDLKNPLQALVMSSESLILFGERFSERELAKKHEQIYKSSIALNELLENLLNWSRSQRGQIAFKPERLKLGEHLAKVIALLSQSAEKKRISIKMKVDEKTAVFADSNMLKTIIRNLVSNSIKFTKPGGEVSVSARNSGDKVRIEVADNGVGIKSEDFEKLFRIDSHFSNKGTMNEQGAGLGLILCSDFVKEHGGEIQVESRPGEGSRFSFELPASKLAAAKPSI